MSDCKCTPTIEWWKSEHGHYTQYAFNPVAFWRDPMLGAEVSLFRYITRDEFTHLIHNGIGATWPVFCVRENHNTRKTSIWVAANYCNGMIPVQWYDELQTSARFLMESMQDYFVTEYNKVVAAEDRVEISGLKIIGEKDLSQCTPNSK